MVISVILGRKQKEFKLPVIDARDFKFSGEVHLDCPNPMPKAPNQN